MSTLSHAEDRALSALGRIERALHGLTPAGRPAPAAADEGRAVLERDRELLREERDALRREMAGLRARQERLIATVDEVEGRLEGAIDQLDALAGE